MKKTFLVVMVLSVVAVSHANVTWEGLDWAPNPVATNLSVISNNLHVTSTGIGWAEYDDSIIVNSDVSFDLDIGSEPVVQVSDYVGSTNRAQFIIDVAAWTLYYDEYDDGGTSNVNFVPVSLASALQPTSGIHTLGFVIGTGGLLDVSIDGSALWSAPVGLEIDGISELRLGAGSNQQGGTGVYTDLVIPEPTTLALLGLGGLLLRRRK